MLLCDEIDGWGPGQVYSVTLGSHRLTPGRTHKFCAAKSWVTTVSRSVARSLN
jgi:hypothetical protein